MAESSKISESDYGVGNNNFGSSMDKSLLGIKNKLKMRNSFTNSF